MASYRDHVTESGDSHVTEQSEERGRVVTLGLRLRDRTVRKQFYTTDTVRVTLTGELTHRLFSWAMHKIMKYLPFKFSKMTQNLSYIYFCMIPVT